MESLFEILSEAIKPVDIKTREAASQASAYGYPKFKGEKHDAFNEGFIEGVKWAERNIEMLKK